MDLCKICNNNAQETHHIKEQELADETNHIEHFHKNNEHNLVPLCKECHSKVTYGNLVIKGYLDTSNGKQLDYYYSDNVNSNSKKKYDSKLHIIQKYKNEYEKSKSNCKKILLLKEDINISIPTLTKIINGQY